MHEDVRAIIALALQYKVIRIRQIKTFPFNHPYVITKPLR